MNAKTGDGDLLIVNDSEMNRDLEALCTVYSYDPCLACAIPPFDATGKERSIAQTQ